MDVPRMDTSKLDEFLDNNMIKTSGEPQQAKLVIHNVYKFLNELKEYPDLLKQLDVRKPRDLTAKICGISVRNVDLVKLQCRNGIPVPKRKRIQQCPVTNVNSYNGNVIKGIVYELQAKGEYPSVKQMIELTRQKIPGFKCSHTSMRKVLKDLGFFYDVETNGYKQMSLGTADKVKRGRKRTVKTEHEVNVVATKSYTDIKKKIIDTNDDTEKESDEDTSESEDEKHLMTFEIEGAMSDQEIKEELCMEMFETDEIKSEIQSMDDYTALPKVPKALYSNGWTRNTCGHVLKVMFQNGPHIYVYTISKKVEPSIE